MAPRTIRQRLALGLLAAPSILAVPAAAQPANLVKDLRLSSSTPALPPPTLWTAQIGSATVFSFDDGVHGAELWVTDGSAAGTQLVIDVCPGICSGLSGSEIVASGGKAFFQGDDGVHGRELWVTDGTPGGTHLVADLIPGLTPSKPAWLTDLGGTLFFSADEPGGNRSLWKTDGTAPGTQLVRSFPGDAANPGPVQLLPFGSKLFFGANDGTHGCEPWISDGSTAGTQLISDVNAGGAPSMPCGVFPFPTRVSDPVVFDGHVYFGAGNPAVQLWRTDGSVGNLELVLGVGPSGFALEPEFLRSLGSTLYFVRADGSGNYLWTYDGGLGGPSPVANVVGDPVLAAGGRLFLFASGPGQEGTELWTTDGGPLVLVKDIRPGSNGAFQYAAFADWSGVVGGRFFSWALDDSGQRTPWTSDGTAGGTQQVLSPEAGTTMDPGYASTPFPVGGSSAFVVYRRVSPDESSVQLWGTDGTPGGTHLIANLSAMSSSNFESQGSRFASLAGGPGTLAFQPSLVQGSYALWTSDGSSAGTHSALDLGGSFSAEMLQWGGLTFLVRDDPAQGLGTFAFDGLNTTLVEGGASPTFVVSDDQVFILDGGNLVATRGTVASTFTIDTQTSYPTVLGHGVAYLTSDAGSCSLRRNDGTLGGNADLTTFTGSCTELAGDGQQLYFWRNGSELWSSDGSAAGTAPVVDLAPAAVVEATPTTSAVRSSLVVQGQAFFVVADPTHGAELWTSDGTAAGTHLVKDIDPGVVGSSPQWLTAATDGVYFVADDGVHGRELWWSDGTDGGTHLVKDIVPGAGSGLPQELAFLDSLLVFSAHDATAGREIWASNGSDAGTVRLQDIAPGPEPSSPMSFTVAGTNVFFYANDGVHGFELWALPRAALADAVSAALDYFTVPPCRLLDTRTEGGALASGVERVIDVAGRCGIPTTARAVAVNVTAVGPTGAGSMALWGANQSAPATSVVSVQSGRTRAASTVLRLATDGSGKVKAKATLVPGGTVDLVLDVAGWFE